MTLEEEKERFKIWTKETEDPNYLDCLFLEWNGSYYNYLDPNRDPRIPLDLQYFRVWKRESAKTEEDKIYQVEYNSYMARRFMSEPMWKLHRTTIERILFICNALEKNQEQPK